MTNTHPYIITPRLPNSAYPWVKIGQEHCVPLLWKAFKLPYSFTDPNKMLPALQYLWEITYTWLSVPFQLDSQSLKKNVHVPKTLQLFCSDKYLVEFFLKFGWTSFSQQPFLVSKVPVLRLHAETVTGSKRQWIWSTGETNVRKWFCVEWCQWEKSDEYDAALWQETIHFTTPLLLQHFIRTSKWRWMSFLSGCCCPIPDCSIYIYGSWKSVLYCSKAGKFWNQKQKQNATPLSRIERAKDWDFD